MAWIQDTLTDFGRQLGIDSLDFGPHGVAQLQLASGGFIAVEPVRRGQEDEVLVYLARPVGHQAVQAVGVALARTHWRNGGPLPVQVGLRGSGADTHLLALVRLPERTFTAQALGHAVDYLGRWLDDVQAGKRP